jgi:thioredoxin-like negative regulator of GroEL
MPELMATLSISRDLNYEEKKFLAAIQGVDLDKNSNKKNAWEELKARVYSKGQASDANDIVALQGQNAKNAGFGIGLGLDYEKLP